MKTFVVATLIVLPASAVAEGDPKFEYGKSDDVNEVRDVEWDASAEGGVVFTTGNSKTTTVAAGFKASRKTGQNKLAIDGGLTYAKSSIRTLAMGVDPALPIRRDDIITTSTTTAETLFGKVRYDRFLTKHNSLFIAALASRDVPAGKAAVVGGQAGYSRQLFKSDVSEALAEIGYDFSHEDLVTGPAVDIHSARGLVGYKATLATGTTFDGSAEVLTNLNKEDLVTRDASLGEDTRVNLRAAVSAKLGRNLALQTSFEGKYDNRPAPLVLGGKPVMLIGESGALEASSFDTIMKVSLIYSFFQKPDNKK